MVPVHSPLLRKSHLISFPPLEWDASVQRVFERTAGTYVNWYFIKEISPIFPPKRNIGGRHSFLSFFTKKRGLTISFSGYLVGSPTQRLLVSNTENGGQLESEQNQSILRIISQNPFKFQLIPKIYQRELVKVLVENPKSRSKFVQILVENSKNHPNLFSSYKNHIGSKDLGALSRCWFPWLNISNSSQFSSIISQNLEF